MIRVAMTAKALITILLFLTVAAPIVIGAEHAADAHRLWVPDTLRPGQLKGALSCSDYAAERSLYSEPVPHPSTGPSRSETKSR